MQHTHVNAMDTEENMQYKYNQAVTGLSMKTISMTATKMLLSQKVNCMYITAHISVTKNDNLE